MADKAIEWLHGVRAQDEQKPLFMYYSTGCAARASSRPQHWADKYRGPVRPGLGPLPRGDVRAPEEARRHPRRTRCSRRGPTRSRPGTRCRTSEKKLYARQMEVYAGFQENADHNVGRLLDAIEEMGELDDTLVIYIFGDNGASMEGTLTGAFNELTVHNGILLTAGAAARADRASTAASTPGAPTRTRRTTPPPGRGPATRPFQWGKQVGLPPRRHPRPHGRLLAASGSRTGAGCATQFTHCIDIGPTILEVAGIPQPVRVDGIEQKPMDGTSFAYTFDDAEAAERHTVQYFETFGNRAIYKDGWWACCQARPDPVGRSRRRRWRGSLPAVYDPEQDTWELYYLPDDFSQANDLAAEHPEKLAELKELFWEEAEKYNVLPLLGGLSVFFGILPPMPTVTRTTFYGDVAEHRVRA